MRMRPLTLLQRQRITLSLFFTVAVGAVFTVAAPAFVPWQVVDNKRAQALDQQRRQGKDFHVIEDHRRRSTDGTQETEQEPDSVTPSSAPISSQGPILSLLTDRSKQGGSTEPIKASSNSSPDANLGQEAGSPNPEDALTTKKRRRRRKRTKVNEGWQELTGRTAREEKERHQQHTPSETTPPTENRSPVLGENGGMEISWKNKSNT